MRGELWQLECLPVTTPTPQSLRNLFKVRILPVEAGFVLGGKNLFVTCVKLLQNSHGLTYVRTGQVSIIPNVNKEAHDRWTVTNDCLGLNLLVGVIEKCPPLSLSRMRAKIEGESKLGTQYDSTGGNVRLALLKNIPYIYRSRQG